MLADQRRRSRSPPSWHRARGGGATGPRSRGRPPPARGALRPRRDTRRTTCPTTATRRWSRRSPGAREALEPAARAPESAIGVVTNQSRRRPRPAHAAPQVDAVNARVERAARAVRTRGRSAPTRPRTAARCRKPAPGLVLARGAGSASTPGLRRDRRHRRRRRGGAARPGARGVLVPTPRPAPRRSRDVARRGTRSRRTPSTLRPRGRGDDAPDPRRCGSTTTATCCSPARRSAPLAAGRRGHLLVAPARRRRPRTCCPASTTCCSSTAPWIRIRRRPQPIPTPCAALVDAAARAVATTRRSIFTSFHQSPLPMALLLPPRRRPAHRRDQRGLPRLAAGRPPPAIADGVPRGRAGTLPSLAVAEAAGHVLAARRRRPPASCGHRCPGRRPACRHAVRRRAPRRLGAGAVPGPGARRARRRRRWPATGGASW